MLLIHFHHVPPGVPFLEVCGLSLGVRAALEGVKNRFERILLLVHPVDCAPAQALLARDHRLCGVTVLGSVDALLADLKLALGVNQQEALLVAGNSVWSGNLLTDFRMAAFLSGRLVRTNQHGGIAMVRMMTVDLVKKIQSDTDQLFPKYQTNDSDKQGQGLEEIDVYEVRSGHDIRGAEDFLLSRLVKQADGIISRNISRKISISLTRRLMNTAVTPNQVTAVVLLVGILSGPAIMGIGGNSGLILGGLLYYAAAVLDGCDGELSRLKLQGTPCGAWLDTVVDDVVGLSYITGLYMYLFMQSAGWGWIGVSALSLYVLTLATRYYVMAFFLGSGDYQKLSSLKPRSPTTGVLSRVVRMLEGTVCRTDFIPFAALVAALIHSSEIFAGLFMLGCIGSAIDSLATFFSMRKKAHSSR